MAPEEGGAVVGLAAGVCLGGGGSGLLVSQISHRVLPGLLFIYVHDLHSHGPVLVLGWGGVAEGADDDDDDVADDDEPLFW